jgi:hypothetical protein
MRNRLRMERTITGRDSLGNTLQLHLGSRPKLRGTPLVKSSSPNGPAKVPTCKKSYSRLSFFGPLNIDAQAQARH